MNAHSLSFRPRCEELEEKNAPSTTTMTVFINPPHGPADTVTVSVAQNGCMNGIHTVMTTTPAAGVITCPQMMG